MFRDVTSLLHKPDIFAAAITILAEFCKSCRADHLVAVEARGFVFAAPLIVQNEIGLTLIRKPGKLPGAVDIEAYTLEYGQDELQIHRDSFRSGARVLIIDDLIATGGTALAATRLIRRNGGGVVGAGFVIDLPQLSGRARLDAEGIPTHALCRFDGH